MPRVARKAPGGQVYHVLNRSVGKMLFGKDADGQVTAFFRWLAHTHAMRWRVAHRTVGYGHLYQGRFQSFPVQSDEHLLTVLRYIERNAVGAGLVARAEGSGNGDAARI